MNTTQPRPLFQKEVVTWLSDGHKLPGDRAWRPGPRPNLNEPIAGEARFASLRVLSRQTARNQCRESIMQMMRRGLAGRRTHRRHGRSALTAFQRRWGKLRGQARSLVVSTEAK